MTLEEAPVACSILMVDDQPENLLALEALLDGMGHRLVKANSGKEALKKVLSEDFAVVLLDVRMPDMDGYETAALIRERERSRHTPIIFLTAAYKSDLQVFQGYSVGAVDYLLKPLTPEILRSKVSVFIDLFRVTERARRQAEALQAANRRMEAEIIERRRAEEEIRRMSGDLELRILERTAELVTANEGLRKEVSERLRAEGRLTASLKEKETLLKEIHHRVKNNLQIVYSLINLQSRQIRDERTLSGLKDCRDRVKAMALVHEKLYRSKDLGRIDLGDYMKDLVASMMRSHGAMAKGVDVRIDLHPVFLTVDDAMPCGMIVYELLSNCLKHAFPEGRRGRIDLSLRRLEDESLSLAVRDDGVGFPAGFKVQEASSLGLQLVSSLSRQLGGNLRWESRDGTEVSVAFRPGSEAPRVDLPAPVTAE